MGRQKPSKGLAPPALRKDARAKKAKLTMSKDIPALLKSDSRAKAGVERSELITDGIPTYDTRMTGSISLRTVDTLEAAHDLYTVTQHKKGKKSRVAVLNMASPLRPGGGVLTGATSQEESLCLRTTLHPALHEEFYRLPDVGAVYTPDVLVFRGWDEHATDLSKHERFYIDVITAAMLRFPDVDEVDGSFKRYANSQDRDLAERKMRAVMGIARSKGISQLVLGAWGCGAYGNPVNEIASLWQKVLLGAAEHDTKDCQGPEALTEGSRKQVEIVFAVRGLGVAQSFAEHFGPGIQTQQDEPQLAGSEEDEDVHASTEGTDKIAELEAQIAHARSPILRERLQVVLAKLKEDHN